MILNSRKFEIGMIAVAVVCVAGIAFPVLQRQRDNANRLLCLENLRRIGEGIREWRLRNDYAFPPGKGMSGFCNSDDGTPLPGNLYAIEPGLNALWDKGRGVIQDPSVFVCPGDKHAEPPPQVGEDFTSAGQLSYAMTGDLYPTDPPNKVVVADKSDKSLPDGHKRASANHGHRYVNVLFFDGRAATFDSPYLPTGFGSEVGSIYVRETGLPTDTYME